MNPDVVVGGELVLVATNGGVVMINFYSGFIVPESARRMAEMFAVSRELRKKFPKEDDYQRERRLNVDGLVGKQTQISINTDLGAADRPRLVRAN